MSVLVLAPSVRTGEMFALQVPELFTSRPKVVTDGERLRGLGSNDLVIWVRDIDAGWNDRVDEWVALCGARVLHGSLDNVSGVRR